MSSVVLHVELPHPVPLETIARQTEATLRELLAVSAIPRVLGLDRPSSTVLFRESDDFTVRLEGYEDKVDVGVIESAVREAYIAVDGATPLQMALAAALGITLARLEQTTVVDDAGYWTPILEQSPDAFVNALAVQGSYADVSRAAEALYAHLEISHYRGNLDGAIPVGLRVEFPQLILIDAAVMQPTARKLQELLVVRVLPTLWLEARPTSPRHPPTVVTLPKGQRFFLGVVGEEGEISLIVGEDQHGRVWGAEITLGAMWTPLEVALVASLAITLVRMAGTTVIDDLHAWSSLQDRAPDALAQAIAVQDPYDDLCQAAAAFYAALPLGQYEATRAAATEGTTRC